MVAFHSFHALHSLHSHHPLIGASSTVLQSTSISPSPTSVSITAEAVTETYSSWATINGTPNPNGPYKNPYDSSSLPFTWPGIPTEGQTVPTPRPDHVFPSGGFAAAHYHGPAWIPKGISALIASLEQADSNGDSQWGILDNCPLSLDGSSSSVVRHSTSPPPYPTSSASTHSSAGGYSNLPPPHPTSLASVSSSAMGSGTSGSSSKNATTARMSTGSGPPTSTADACGTAPDTGVTRSYDFTVSYQTIAPDGVTKNGLVVNGGFPGPLIEANWGDTIQVHVTNALPDEGTALHWHGLSQKGTPYYDGVPGVGQCPIAPGKDLTYTFKADMYGSSWYHSEFSQPNPFTVTLLKVPRSLQCSIFWRRARANDHSWAKDGRL